MKAGRSWSPPGSALSMRRRSTFPRTWRRSEKGRCCDANRLLLPHPWPAAASSAGLVVLSDGAGRIQLIPGQHYDSVLGLTPRFPKGGFLVAVPALDEAL